MGNPAPQPRGNSPKTNTKPKHRHSGSVSSISFTSEDPKPKHRHSGSVSNISLTPEDLKPKHRHSGSASNISLTPEDLKPKHRHSGSASNISLTPEDLKPKHRHSGSVSNISITPPAEDLKDLKPKHRRSGSVSSSIITNAQDFTSPSRGDASRSSSPLSVPSSSSAVSLKEKRTKRRARSSLGGTEDFIKELDFLAIPSPSGKPPDSSSARKELLKPSPSPPLSESAPLQAAAEVLTPVPEASVSVHERIGVSPTAVEHLNGQVAKANVGENGGSSHGEKCFGSAHAGENGGSSHCEKSFNSANVGENGGSPHGEKCVSSANVGENGGSPRQENSVSLADWKTVQAGDAALLEESVSNGVNRESTGTVETSRDEHVPEPNNEGNHEVLAEIPSTTGNGLNEVYRKILEEILPTLENGHILGIAASLPLVGTVTREFDDSEPIDLLKEAAEAPESIVEVGLPPESVVADTAGASTPLNISGQEGFTESNNNEHSVTGGIVMPLANGDSQLSPSSEDELSQDEQAARDTQEEVKVSVQKRIEELEKIAGGRPVHFRSQSLSLPRPFDVSHARHHEAEASKGFRMPAYKAPLDSTSVSEVGSPELVGTSPEEVPQRSFQLEGSASTNSTVPTTGLDVGETLVEDTEPQKVPPFHEAQKAVEVTPDSMVNGIHLENGMTPESSGSLLANKTDSIAASETADVTKALATTVEQKEVEIGKGLERGVGEAYVIGSADFVPKELHSEASAGQTEENGGKLEIVEPPPRALKSGTTIEAAKSGMLPSAHQRGTFAEVPSAQASVAEQASQDYETTMLLTKQPAVDPLFIDSQQDRLWEMHSQELTIGESSGQEVRESSAQDDDPRQYANGTPTHAEVTPSGSTSNGNAQSDKSSRPRTPLRSLLAEEDAEKCPDSGPLGTPPQNQSVSPRGSIFKRIVSGGKNSPTKQTTASKFSPKSQSAAKPFLSSCMCCSVK